MCTLAWGQDSGRLWACFNRDEQRTRAPAQPPRWHELAGARLVHAVDPDGGGTWFSANAAGHAVALLNGYRLEGVDRHPGAPSRGRIVMEAAACGSPLLARDRLLDMDLSAYAPFFVFILSPAQAFGIAWDGKGLGPLDPLPRFWTTSSFNRGEILPWRRAWWRERTGGRPGLALAARLMRERDAARPAFGLTMDRDDARTQSQIELTLAPGNLVFRYREREPDGPGYREALEIRHGADA